MLPTSTITSAAAYSLPSALGGGSGGGGVWASLPQYLKRALKWDQMDMEYTSWQMFYLCLSPRKVYRTTKLHKQTKNQWARDDPAFVVVQLYLLGVAALAFAVSFHNASLWAYLRVVLWAVVVDFCLAGAAIATGCWALANQRLIVPTTQHTVAQRVEWLYAFDVHCNSFFPVFVLLYVVQFFLAPLLLGSSFLSTFAANTLYALALSYYWYVTYLGYQVLPFLQGHIAFLYPVVGIAVTYVLALLSGENAATATLGFYFPS